MPEPTDDSAARITAAIVADPPRHLRAVMRLLKRDGAITWRMRKRWMDVIRWMEANRV